MWEVQDAYGSRSVVGYVKAGSFEEAVKIAYHMWPNMVLRIYAQ